MALANDFEIFWGEISPSEHAVQIYSDDQPFLDALEGFVAGALRVGDAAIIIATPSHHASLNRRLAARQFDLNAMIATGQYIPLDAATTLAQFMRDGRPDEHLFNQCVDTLLARARGNGRRVRAFGEMVALLWAQGHSGATMRLEHLWHGVCQREDFALFCAYPRTGFTKNPVESMREICDTHSRVIESVH